MRKSGLHSCGGAGAATRAAPRSLTQQGAPPYTGLAMDLQLAPQHLAFRDELRTWLGANLKRAWRDEVRAPGATEAGLIDIRRAWQKRLHGAGYLGIAWPREWGGRGATEVEQSIFEEETARADAP